MREASSAVTADVAPPDASTRVSGPRTLPNRTTPSLFHAQPGAFGPIVSHRVCGGLPTRSTFLSLAPVAEYATKRLSADQKKGGAVGVVSVPGSGRTSSESMKRIHTRGTPSDPTAENASLRPSGDSVKFLPAVFT